MVLANVGLLAIRLLVGCCLSLPCCFLSACCLSRTHPHSLLALSRLHQEIRTLHMDRNHDQRNEMLCKAAREGDDAQVVSLLAQQADINWKGCYGWNSLRLAAIEGHTSTCQLLIDNKADVDACDRYNRTPLHLAVWRSGESYATLFILQPFGGRTSICQLLIDNKADIDACDCINRTPLHLAVVLRHSSVCSLLIDTQADCNIRSVSM